VRTVTALRAAGRGRVAVELDERPWRTLPLEAVVRAGLAAGLPLDRPRARTLAREVRRLRALRTATAALAGRDRSTQELRQRLEVRGVPPRERERTVEVLAAAGALDDARAALSRARTLCERGSGDALIRADLEARGLEGEAVAHALAALEPERERAARIAARRGPGPATARYLAARGFDEETVATTVAWEAGESVE
jgi:regulatory protein